MCASQVFSQTQVSLVSALKIRSGIRRVPHMTLYERVWRRDASHLFLLIKFTYRSGPKSYVSLFLCIWGDVGSAGDLPAHYERICSNMNN